MPLYMYLGLSATLLMIGLAGLIMNRKSIITSLMCIELILLAVSTNFLAFSYYLHTMIGQVFVFFILTVAAAEAAIGLAILIAIFRYRHTIDLKELDTLKG